VQHQRRWRRRLIKQASAAAISGAISQMRRYIQKKAAHNGIKMLPALGIETQRRDSLLLPGGHKMSINLPLVQLHNRCMGFALYSRVYLQHSRTSAMHYVGAACVFISQQMHLRLFEILGLSRTRAFVLL